MPAGVKYLNVELQCVPNLDGQVYWQGIDMKYLLGDKVRQIENKTKTKRKQNEKETKWKRKGNEKDIYHVISFEYKSFNRYASKDECRKRVDELKEFIV